MTFDLCFIEYEAHILVTFFRAETPSVILSLSVDLSTITRAPVLFPTFPVKYRHPLCLWINGLGDRSVVLTNSWLIRVCINKVWFVAIHCTECCIHSYFLRTFFSLCVILSFIYIYTFYLFFIPKYFYYRSTAVTLLLTLPLGRSFTLDSLCSLDQTAFLI